MTRGNSLKMTIGGIMGLIVVVALVIGAIRDTELARAISIIGGFVGFVFLVIALCVMIIDMLIGVRCPHCGAWTMARTSVISFRDRYFQCGTCRVRCRRGVLLNWQDASDRQFDRFFTRDRPENPWTAPPGVADEEENLIYSKTHGNLLRNKQRRQVDQIRRRAEPDPTEAP
jgi:hypothetical protein